MDNYYMGNYQMNIKKMPMIIGHRGGAAASKYEENSLSAITYGLHGGADGVEIDTCLTHDCEVVVNHDQDFQGVLICETDYGDLKNMQNPPRLLKEYVELMDEKYPSKILNVELKNNHKNKLQYVVATAAVLANKKNRGDTLVVQSFDAKLREFIKNNMPELHIAATADKKFNQLIAKSAHAEFKILSLYHKNVDKNLIDKARKNKIEIHVWHKKRHLKKERVLQLADCGVAAIISDYPHRCREWLTAAGYKPLK